MRLETFQLNTGCGISSTWVLCGGTGGQNNNPEGFDKGFEISFTVRFKSVEARDQFTADPRNNAFKVRRAGLLRL